MKDIRIGFKRVKFLEIVRDEHNAIICIGIIFGIARRYGNVLGEVGLNIVIQNYEIFIGISIKKV